MSNYAQVEQRTADCTFATGWVSCSADSLVVAESLCHTLTFVLKSPPIVNSPNRSGIHCIFGDNTPQSKGAQRGTSRARAEGT